MQYRVQESFQISKQCRYDITGYHLYLITAFQFLFETQNVFLSTNMAIIDQNGLLSIEMTKYLK